MRVAIVSPYSWTYPGGVTRHIEALAEALFARDHDVRVLAPFDPDTRRAALLHKGARPQPRQAPEWLVPLGGTVGWASNGAVSNLAFHPTATSLLRRELRGGDYDVVHVHEPVAPWVGWDALSAVPSLPVVGTFHCYSEARIPHVAAVAVGARRKLNRLSARIAVSEAAAWTGRRFYGGRYRIVPNGVHVPAGGAPSPRERAAGEPLRIAFVGQAVERKGLPVLLRAFEALREHVPAELVVVGASREELAPLVNGWEGLRVLGRIGDAEKRAVLQEADVLAAPSLGGESFGMVLTEAFAAGTTVVASDIAGYRDVVAHSADGLLVPRGDATRLAEVLRDLALDPERVRRLGDAAAAAAGRYAWPHVAAEVEDVYGMALARPEPDGALEHAAVRYGFKPADGQARLPARRLPTLEPDPDIAGVGSPVPAGAAPVCAAAAAVPPRRRRILRRGAVAAAGLLTAAGGVWAVERVGPDEIGAALVRSSPVWVLVALALMCGSMLLRAVSWHAILRAALPEALPRLRDAIQGTSIGVLMSATLPARAGEPSRALIVARRLGRPRERLPTVMGTLISQTLLNVLALVILGAVMFSTIGLFAGRQQALIWYGAAPLAVVAAVLLVPALMPSGLPSRRTRMGRLLAQARTQLGRVRSGLVVFRRPREGAIAVIFQLSAWAAQWVSCYVLLIALGLDERGADLGAAAAVLFAVNVSAVLPVTPSNLGVFQAACVAVLTGAYGIPAAQALGYGIILQAVEIATAVVMGGPALVKEGLSWRDVRLRAMQSTPVSLGPPPSSARIADEPR